MPFLYIKEPIFLVSHGMWSKGGENICPNQHYRHCNHHQHHHRHHHHHHRHDYCHMVLHWNATCLCYHFRHDHRCLCRRLCRHCHHITTRHYVPPLASFFHQRRKIYVQYMFVDYVLNNHIAYLSNLLTAQIIQSDYLRVTGNFEKIHKCCLVKHF